MSDARPPRFPYAAALLCAACLGAAAWTWMMYSYAWDVTPRQLDRRFRSSEGLPGHGDCWYFGKYARLHGKRDPSPPMVYVNRGYLIYLVYGDTGIVQVRGRSGAAYYSPVVVEGRLVPAKWGPHFDTTASRFTGESVAGLVVGAMGVFVFAFALRDWLNRRRHFRVQKAEGET